MDQVLKQLAEEYQIADWVQMGIVFCFRMNLIVCLKQEAVFAKQNGYKNALENIRAIGMCPETQQNIKNSNMEGIKRRILFKALQWKRWRLVYCLASLWVYLEKNIKS